MKQPIGPDAARLSEFLTLALSGASTMSKPDPRISIVDLAFAIQFIDGTNEKNIQKAHTDLVHELPIACLLNEALELTEKTRRPDLMNMLIHLSDKEVRKTLSDRLLYIVNPVHAAENSRIGKEILRRGGYEKRLWGIFIKTLGTPNTYNVPFDVPDDIRNAIIAQRCTKNLDPVFATETYTMEEARDHFTPDTKDHLLNSEHMCSIVQNLNTMSDKKLKRQISDVIRLLQNNPPSVTTSKNAVAYKTLYNKVGHFKAVVNSWELLLNDNDPETRTRKTLANAAQEIIQAADDCKRGLKTIHNMFPNTSPRGGMFSWFSKPLR